MSSELVSGQAQNSDENSPLLNSEPKGEHEEEQKSKEKSDEEKEEEEIWPKWSHPIYYACDVDANLGLIFGRTRKFDTYCLDGMRALVHLWVLTDIFQIGTTPYMSGLDDWFDNYGGILTFVGQGDALVGSQGVTSFYVLSGFVITSSLNQAAEELDEKVLSTKTVVHFLFRRFAKIAPALWISVMFAMVYGYTSTNPTIQSNFYGACKTTWWTNFVFLTNFTVWAGWGTEDCYSTNWAISAEMQFYILSIIPGYFYQKRPIVGWVVLMFMTAMSVYLRSAMVYYVDLDPTNRSFQVYVTEPFFTRFDAFGMGMMVYYLWVERIKPIRKKRLRPKTPAELEAEAAEAAAAVAALSVSSKGSASKKSGKGSSSSGKAGATDTSESGKKSSSSHGTDKTSPSTGSAGGGVTSKLVGSGEARDAVMTAGTEGGNSGDPGGIEHHHSDEYEPREYTTMFIVTEVILWILSLFFLAGGIYSIAVSAEVVPSWFPFSLNYYISYTYFMWAAGMASLMYISLHGAIWPLTWFLSMGLWTPLANLAYTGGLFALIAANMYGSWIDTVTDDPVRWAGGYADYLYMYFQVVVLDTMFAFVIAILIEKPMVHLSREVNLDWLDFMNFAWIGADRGVGGSDANGTTTAAAAGGGGACEESSAQSETSRGRHDSAAGCGETGREKGEHEYSHLLEPGDVDESDEEMALGGREVVRAESARGAAAVGGGLSRRVKAT